MTKSRPSFQFYTNENHIDDRCQGILWEMTRDAEASQWRFTTRCRIKIAVSSPIEAQIRIQIYDRIATFSS
jgi:hypothetical protein